MDIYMEFDEGDYTYKAFYDSHHETRGSYAYSTEEETKRAEDEELAKLESGEWVALFCVKYKPCPTCHNLEELDSVGGCVVENDEDKVKEYILDYMPPEEEE